MRVSIQPQDQLFKFWFINSIDTSVVSGVSIPMKGFWTTSLKEGTFQINMKNDERHIFKGKIGNDDEITWDPWMLLKYAILDEEGGIKDDDIEEEVSLPFTWFDEIQQKWSSSKGPWEQSPQIHKTLETL